MDFWSKALARHPNRMRIVSGATPGRAKLDLGGGQVLDVPEAPEPDLVEVLNGVAGFDIGRGLPAARTLEYRPERDGPPMAQTLEYRPERDGRPQVHLLSSQVQGGGVSEGEPEEMEQVIAGLTAQPAEAEAPERTPLRLGSLSATYESNGNPATVSTGEGDAGGVSYGSYQFATNRGVPQAFLNNEGAAFAGDFRGLQPGTPEFSAAWRRAAATDPEGFEQAQHDFTRRTYYEPLVNRVYEETGVELGRVSDALQDAAWSTAVQHGERGETSIVSGAIRSVQTANPELRPGTPEFDSAVVRAIYAERGRTNAAGGLVRFPSSSAAVQRGVARRFGREAADAETMLRDQYPQWPGQ